MTSCPILCRSLDHLIWWWGRYAEPTVPRLLGCSGNGMMQWVLR